jgi:hypothetical protein
MILGVENVVNFQQKPDSHQKTNDWHTQIDDRFKRHLLTLGKTWSNLVRPNPTQSNRIKPIPKTTAPHLKTTHRKDEYHDERGASRGCVGFFSVWRRPV